MTVSATRCWRRFIRSTLAWTTCRSPICFRRRIGLLPGSQLELSRDVLQSLDCPRCGQSEELFVSLGKVRSDKALCPHCPGVRREVKTFFQIGNDPGIHGQNPRPDRRAAAGHRDCPHSAPRLSVSRWPLTENVFLDPLLLKRRPYHGSSNRGKRNEFLWRSQFCPPAAGRDGELSGPRTPTFQFVFRQSVLNRVHVHGDSSLRAEICGVLVGDVYRDELGPFVLIEHVIEGQASTGSAPDRSRSPPIPGSTSRLLMDKQYPDLRIVGWYHTHPGHGVFLSDMDIFLHESFSAFRGKWRWFTIREVVRRASSAPGTERRSRWSI